MESTFKHFPGRAFSLVILVVFCVLIAGSKIKAQNVAVTDVDGYNPHASAMLDVNSTSKGLLLPRVTTAQMNAIATPAAGLMVYNTTVAAIYIFNGSSWLNLLSFGVSALTAPDGTPNNALVVDNSGNIGINQPVPLALLHIKGSGSLPDNYMRMESSTGGYYGNIFYDSQGMKFRTRNNGSGFYFQEDGGNTNLAIQDNGWVGIGNSTPWGKLEVKGDASMSSDSAIFVVRNRNGFPVFAVYDGGVRIYIDDAAGIGKGGKGGFAVSGRSAAKSVGTLNDIFVLSPDSARFYLESSSKGGKGGFAVGGRSPNKGTITNFMNVTPLNYFIGEESGAKITTGYYNSFMGYQAGRATTTGSWNVFTGHQAGYSNTGGNYNVFSGAGAGFSNLAGSYNVFVGYQSGYSNTSGGYNSFLGFQSGYSNSTGANNSFIGYQAGLSNTTGSMNIFIGFKTAQGNTTGGSNSVIGNYAGRGLTTGSDNTYLGTWAGYNNAVGNKNVFIGFWAGLGYRDGHNNVFIGNEAGLGNNTVAGGDNNIALGSYSGHSISTGTNNVFMGQSAGYSAAGASSNVFIGYQSGYSNVSSNYNAFIGYQSGYYNNGGQYNAFMGYQSGFNNTTGFYNTFMGYYSGYSNTTAGFNTMIGYHAGYFNTDKQEQAFFGYKAGYSNTTGDGNTYLGAESGYWVTDGTQNTYVGQISGRQGYGSYNVYLGNGAGYSASGSNNVFLGYNAGWSETGSNKLIIENSGAGATGALIYGDFSTPNLRFNANVAVNAAPGSYKFYSYDNTPSSDLAAIYGQHDVTDNYGVGVYGKGGYKGVVAENNSTSGTCYGVLSSANGSGTGIRYGTYSSAYGGSTNYGIYAYASGGSTNWAGYFIGNVYTSGTYQSSDANLKKNITTIPSALSKLNAMRGVYFEWKESGELPVLKSAQIGGREAATLKEEKPLGQQVGVIAQEVEKVVPEAVITDENGYKAVDYSKLVPILIEAVKEQQKTINDLQNRISKLEPK